MYASDVGAVLDVSRWSIGCNSGDLRFLASLAEH